ncbi:MAG: hypothetical protein AB7F86_10910 [Bdellovibrionales bacterium]
MVKKSILSLLLGLTFLTAACAKKSHTHSNGGGGVVDGGGGGDFLFSTEEDVKDSIEKAWKLFYGREDANVLLQALSLFLTEDRQVVPLDEEGKTAHQVLSKAIGAEYTPVRKLDLKYLEEKKLQLKTDGLCQGPHDHKYLASVSKLAREAEVCVSVYGLMRLPTGSLQVDVVALLAHEIAHLNGFGEKEAQATQKFFLRNMRRILRKDGKTTRLSILHDFKMRIAHRWPDLVTYELVDHEYVQRVVNLLARLFSDSGLFTYGAFSDDIEIQNPRLVVEVRAQKQAVYQRLEKFTVELAESVKAGRSSQLSPAQLAEVGAISNQMIDLYQLVETFIEGKPVDKSINKEREWIAKAINPETLTRPELRPRLICQLIRAKSAPILHEYAPMFKERYRCVYNTNSPALDGILDALVIFDRTQDPER